MDCFALVLQFFVIIIEFLHAEFVTLNFRVSRARFDPEQVQHIVCFFLDEVKLIDC